MKPKKSLFLIVILSFLFITNFVIFSIIQRPLYAGNCNFESCEPFRCEAEAWSWCGWVCRNLDSECMNVELEDSYCAQGPWWPCECHSLWTVTCTDETSFYYGCHELNSMDCPFPI
jgi:hypothetical protein